MTLNLLLVLFPNCAHTIIQIINLKYVATYSAGFQAFPTSIAESCIADGSCTAGTTATTETICSNPVSMSPATVPDVATCFTGTNLTAKSNLTKSSTCAAGSKFCKVII